MNVNEIALSNLTTELERISNLELREYVKTCIKQTPGLFWKKPSAFYIGHHPQDEIADWGNLRHVKRVVSIAMILRDIENLPDNDSNILIASCILHDIGKYGIDGLAPKIQSNHPQLATHIIPQGHVYRNDIIKTIEAHMGRWGKVLPSNTIEKLCHYADCIASRTSLNIPINISVNNM
jgi:hypothetical protein